MRRTSHAAACLVIVSLVVAACVDDATPPSGTTDGGGAGGGDAGGGGGGGGSGDSGAGGTGSDAAGGGDAASGATGKRVFLTSSTSNAAFGSVDAADGLCQQLADAAGLGGTYKAWLSDDTASSTPPVRFKQSTAAPYVRVDGAKVAKDFASIVGTGASLQHPINVTEKSDVVTGAWVWTNTTADGSYASSTSTCMHWASTSDGTAGPFIGYADEVGPFWTQKDYKPCSTDGGHLYCFEQ